MKNITPIHWKRNSPDVTQLSIQLVYDNLSTTCTTFWQVKTNEGISIDQGNITITGDDYLNWDGSNNFVYQFVADQLGIELISGIESYGAGLGTENI